MANTLKFGNGEWYGKKDTILAYNDENSNYKPLPFNFSRASKATVVNKDGLIEEVGSGQPRIDYKDDSKGALLLEPTRSNIVTDSATGRFKLPTPSLINTLAPDNSNLAVIPIVYSVANRYEYIISGGTYSTNAKLTYSWYRKRISTPMDDTYLGDLIPSGVNLSYVGDTKQIESNINGYDRFEAVLNITDGSATTTVRMYFGDVIGVGNSSIAYWGHQLEQGSYATSYIPTSGSAVTRVADNITQTTPNLSNSQEITVFIDLGARPLTGINTTSNNFRLDFGTGNTRIIYNQNSSSNHRIELNNNGSANFYTLSNLLTTTRAKIGVSLTPTTLVIYANGVEYYSVSIASADWSNLLEIETLITDAIGNIKINDFKFYNTALTDQELIALTQV
jgi:hypothetical protein